MPRIRRKPAEVKAAEDKTSTAPADDGFDTLTDEDLAARVAEKYPDYPADYIGKAITEKRDEVIADLRRELDSSPAANDSAETAEDEAERTARDEYIDTLIADSDLTDTEIYHVRIAIFDGHPIEDAIAATVKARDAAAGLKFEIEEVDDPDFINLYGGAFKAVCDDGWESEVRTTAERAEASAEEHRDVVRSEAFAAQVT